MPKEGMHITSKHIILPIIYFITLSFGLLFVASYWLVNGYKNIEKSYAKEVGETLDSVVIDLDGTPEELQLTVKDPYDCDDEAARQIDRMFADTPLASYGCVFTVEAKKADMSPYLLPAISWCESGLGTSKTSGAWNNPFSWGINDSEETRNEAVYLFDDLKQSIITVTKGISSKAERRGETTDPYDVVQWYTPGQVITANGDPAQTRWYSCVTEKMTKIQSVR